MNCIVVDDEPIARMGMEDLIAENSHLHFLKSFKSTVGVAEYLKHNQVDLVFLDIEMPGTNGLEFAASIPEQTLIIFTTAYAEYAADSYVVDSIDYLLKPIQAERFNKAVSKAVNYSKLLNSSKASLETAAEDFVMIRADRKFHKVAFDQITHIEGLKDYIILYTKETKYITWINLKNIQLKLPEDIFLRVSKSYIVNQQAITAFDNNSVYIGKIEVPVGKAYQEDFYKYYVQRTQS